MATLSRRQPGHSYSTHFHYPFPRPRRAVAHLIDTQRFDLPPQNQTCVLDSSQGDIRTFYPYTPNEVKHRKRTTRAQLKVLESVYKYDTKPNASLRKKLAAELDMTPRGVQVLALLASLSASLAPSSAPPVSV